MLSRICQLCLQCARPIRLAVRLMLVWALRSMMAGVKRAPSANWKALQAQLPSKRKRPRLQAAALATASTSADIGSSTMAAVPPTKESDKLREALLKGSEGMSQAKLQEPGKFLAIDCEMVGVGIEGKESVLARVSLVNYYGTVVLDTFVRPQERVWDLRTWVSGVTRADLESAPDFKTVTERVAKAIDGKVLIGHAIHNEFKALRYNHPRQLVRDTQLYKPLQRLAGTKRPGLKRLAKQLLDIDIQSEAHSSIDDARATMAVYRTQKTEWERTLQASPATATASSPTDERDSPVSAPHARALHSAAAGRSKKEPLSVNAADDPLVLNVSTTVMPRRGEKMATLGLASTLQNLVDDEKPGSKQAKKSKRRPEQRRFERDNPAHADGAKSWWEL